MANIKVESKEIIWCESNDRYIYVEKDYGIITGLNFMQGDDLEVLKESYLVADKDLTNFYNAIAPYLSGDEIENINTAIWVWFEYKNNYNN